MSTHRRTGAVRFRFAVVYLLAASSVAGQSVSLDAMRMDMDGMTGPYAMSREASGTSWQPDSTPMEGMHQMHAQWNTMWHGSANFIRDRQGGPRGGEKTFSSSMLMFMARRDLKDGAFGVHFMLSADPLMGPSGYPELFQTGETADGVHPLVDRQHPHNLLMEAAAVYSVNLGAQSALYGYGGLAGEPALGPPTFMHRFSGMDNPEAPLGHHWLDSTHVTYGVLTGGYVWRRAKIELSAFNGREPDQHRYAVELRRLDSFAARLSFNPTRDLSLQFSTGRLASPEQLSPAVSIRRSTASASYNHAAFGVEWQTTIAWGRNDPSAGAAGTAWLAESAAVVARVHTLFGRVERVSKDEIILPGAALYGRRFTINALSVGYIFDIAQMGAARVGLGALVSAYRYPRILDAEYGSDPVSYMAFLRVRL